jgi:hypothetical protein
MNEDRWRRIEELYHAARLLKESARASFLTAATEGDEELCREVESLLVSGVSSPGFLDEPVQTAGAAALLSDAESFTIADLIVLTPSPLRPYLHGQSWCWRGRSSVPDAFCTLKEYPSSRWSS